MSELQCYNRGCGLKYKESENTAESCRHHPGEPFFHDAYKGWSCCNKKCTDFTEFLNIKGCTLSKHSNVKPPEPEKPKETIPDDEVIEVKPIIKSAMIRPPYETPMNIMKPEIAPSLKQEMNNTTNKISVITNESSDGIAIGTICKNGGCNASYEGPASETGSCVHHPGTPIFHEGMKFWSCCQKRTSDFNAFLNQIGCETGTHVWKKKDDDPEKVQCRWDFHQTVTHVIVSIYAKQYCPVKSEILLNPIRLIARIVFPQQNDAVFSLDHELLGIVDVDNSQVTMFGTKVEIKLKKAEPGSWTRLDVVKARTPETNNSKAQEDISDKVESVDLNDL